MPEELKESYDTYKEFSENWTDYSLIEEEPTTLEILGIFRDTYEKLMPKAESPKAKRKTTAKGRAIKAKGAKATAKIKKAKATQKANAKPRPKKVQPAAATSNSKSKPAAKPKATEKAKKDKDCDCEEKKKVKSDAKPKSPSKPKTEKKAEAKPASAKKATEKKPTASDKAVEKAREELRKVKAENREYEKRIMFDSDFLTSLLMKTQGYARNRKGLGALPTELSQELKKERALNTLYRQVMKRNVKAFKSLEVRLKKSNEVTPAMERKFMLLYSTLNGLKQSAVAKRKVTVKKKKKGFLARLFS